MPKDYAEQPYTHVRRSDRAVEDEGWIKQFLHHAAVGTLATVYEGQPFINSNLYVYDEAENAIYIHTARVGRTRANIEHSEKVCFSIMSMGRLLPAPEALEFSVEYSGVVVFGEGYVVEDEAEAKRALQMMLDKYAPHLKPGEDYRAPIKEELDRTAVYRVNIINWTGKKKEVAHDFPGAYLYEDVRK